MAQRSMADASGGKGKPIDLSNYIGGEEAVAIAARSLRSLKKDINDLSKTVADDSGRIAAGFATIKQGIADIQSKAGKLNLFSGEDKAVLTALAQQLGELKKRQEDYKATQAAQATIQRGLTDSVKVYNSELAKQKQALIEAQKAGDVEGQRRAAAAIRQTTTETAQLSKALRGANSEFTAAKGSYNALVIENNKLIASLQALEGGLMSGSQEALKLKKQIFDNTQTLKDFDAETNRNFRNVGNYAQSFSGLIAELAKARAAQANFTEGTAESARQQMRIAGFQTAAQKAAAQAGLTFEQAEAKINGYTAAVQPLTTALARLEKEQEQLAKTTGEDTEAYRKIGFQIQQTKKEIDDVAVATVKAGDAQGSLGQQLGFTKQGLKDYVTQLAVGAIGLQAIASGVQAVFEANVEYSRNLAEVRKTTGLTADEAERLAQSLKELDTPTNLAGLLKIASVGGQLGIAKDDLLGFTKAIDTAVQALGNDFSGGAQEIAETLGKIGAVYRKELGADTAQNILAVGSAVNELGAVGSATSPFLAEVALRVGAVASQSGIGLKNVLAYAAVLQETGTTAEVAGSSLNRLFSTLSTKTEESFRIAQRASPSLTLKEFTKLVNTDFNQAIQLFLKGLNAGNVSTTEQARLLATLKLQSGEAKSAIVTLAANTDLFAERQKVANDQLRDATSLSKEAAVNTDTLAGSVDKNINAVKNFFTSGTGGNILKFLIDIEAEMIKLVALPFQKIGDGISYIGQKVGLIDKPLSNYTTSIVDNTLAARKQVAAQQELLKSYQSLEGTTGRTAAQELELAKTRGELLKQFGTTDAAAIQAGIDKRKAAAESNIQFFKNDIAQYDELIAKTQAKAAAAQNTLNVAPRNDQGVLSTRAGQDAAQSLLVLEKALTEQQRQRAQAVAALAKLEGTNTEAKKDGIEVTEEAVKAEEQLGRAAKSASERRQALLQEELAANQRRIDELIKFKAEQDKLFTDGQINAEVYQDSVAGLQDGLIQLERNGTAIRIRLAKEETVGKLAEIEKERTQSLAKKKITQREINDIDQDAANKAGLARDKQLRDIEKFQRDLQAKETSIEPLQFKIAGLDQKTLNSIEKGISDAFKIGGKTYEETLEAAEGVARAEMAAITRQLAQGKISRRQYEQELSDIRDRANKKALVARDAFHKAENDIDLRAAEKQLKDAEDLANRRKEIADKAGNSLITIDGYYAQFRQQGLDIRLQQVQASYDAEVAAAGENAALKQQIEKKYQKEIARLNYEKAKIERNQAAFTVAIQTAVAVAKSFAESPATFGLPFSAIALANGLIQEALIFSKPLPQYFKGRKSGPAEWAEVAERGPELIQKADTGRFVYQATRAIVPLGKDDVVHTAAETASMLAAAGLSRQQAQQPTQLTAALNSVARGAASARESAESRGYGKLAENLAANTAALKKIQAPKITVHKGSDASVETSRNLTHYASQRRFKTGD